MPSGLRASLLAAGRSVWKLPPLEQLLLRLTRNRPYEGFVSKLPPLWTSYRPGHAIRRVRRGGVHLELDLSQLAEWYAYWGFQEPSLDSALALCQPGMTVIDVGAHIGLFTLRFARIVGPEGHLHAIEPDRTNYARLRRHLDLNPDITWISTHNVGVSDSPGTIRIETLTEHNRSPRVSDTGDEVQAVPLDSLSIKPDLIKMDIEGYEPRALAGATETLADRPAMFVEVSHDLLLSQGSSAQELLDLLTGLGYRLVDQQTGRPPAMLLVHTDVICLAA